MASKVLQKANSFYDQYFRNPSADKKMPHYCPGCGHGNVHKFIAEALDDFEVADKTIFISPVGCSVFAYYYFDTGNIQAAHGRAPAVATGIKRAHPHSIVISYQGDGDLAAIGTAEILHAANRGENITVFFINNAIYGMTGGQMAPTTLIEQRTTTSPRGRNPHNEGYPVKVAELISQLQAPVYVERVALFDNKQRAKARIAVRKAIKNQVENLGFSLVEILSPCPSGWKMDPVDSMKWIRDVMLPQFPLGVYKDLTKEVKPYEVPEFAPSAKEIKELIDIVPDSNKKFKKSKVIEKYINPEIKVAGFGGQGVLLLGAALAQAGMLEDYHVSWLPSYGPEMRGGTANCHVNVRNIPVGSPVVSNPTVLIALNRPSLEKFEQDVEKDGLIIFDSSLIDLDVKRKDVEALPLPATQLADKLGNTRTANMITLAAYAAYTGLFSKETLYETLKTAIKRRVLIDINKKAIDVGYEFGLTHRKN
ncbi:MAG: 2-oxoacid:acceptor oxidoreductase family protein [Calditrichaceae bacterium]|nr:2-oxoacid:acceptor oxidoreductase family protein [Calditrichaceae bacterium]